MWASGAAAMDALWDHCLALLSFIDDREEEWRSVRAESLRRYRSAGISGLDEWFAECWGRPSAEAASAWAEVGWRLGYVEVDRLISESEWEAIGLSSPERWRAEPSATGDALRTQHPPSLEVGKFVLCYVHDDGRWAFVDLDSAPPFDVEKPVRNVRLPNDLAVDGLVFAMPERRAPAP